MIKRIINSHWGFMRWLRLILGVSCIIAGIVQHDSLVGFFGGFFLFQSVMNVTCCGSSACNVDYKSDSKSKDVEFEEVKN